MCVCVPVYVCVFVGKKESLCVFNALNINLADVGIPVVRSHSLLFSLSFTFLSDHCHRLQHSAEIKRGM